MMADRKYFRVKDSEGKGRRVIYMHAAMAFLISTKLFIHLHFEWGKTSFSRGNLIPIPNSHFILGGERTWE